MIEASNYSVIETLRDGHPMEIRALKPEDGASLALALERLSAPSLYRRFFAVRRNFTEKEADYFVNVDFVNHVALIAVIKVEGRPTIVGGGRYVLVQPGRAEVAFAVTDEYQGKGVGAALMRHLTAIAREAGIGELIADVLSENTPMLKLFEKCGCRMSTTRDAEVVHVTLGLI